MKIFIIFKWISIENKTVLTVTAGTKPSFYQLEFNQSIKEHFYIYLVSFNQVVPEALVEAYPALTPAVGFFYN